MSFFPEMHQLKIEKENKNYFKSVFLGVVTPIMHLPEMIFQMLLVPFYTSAYRLVYVVLGFIYEGFKGNLTSRNITIDDALKEFFQEDK